MLKSLLLLLLLSSCAAMEADYKNRVCNSGGAYSLGVSDKANKEKANPGQLSLCGSNSSKYYKAYADGYNAATSAESSGEDDNSNEFWECKLRVFGTDFIGKNENKGKAKYYAKKNCLAKNSEISCDEDYECQKY